MLRRKQSKPARPSPLTRFSTSVVSLLKGQPSEPRILVLPDNETRGITDSPTSSMLSLPLIEEPTSIQLTDDSKQQEIADLHGKLQEAALAIESRAQTMHSLEERIRSSSATIELQKSALLEAEEAKATAEAAKVRAEEELSGTQQQLASTRAELHETLNGFAAVQRELENATALTESKVAEADAERRSRAAIEEELYDAHKQKQELETAHLQTVRALDVKTAEMETERTAREKIERQCTELERSHLQTTVELQERIAEADAARDLQARLERELCAAQQDKQQLENTLASVRAELEAQIRETDAARAALASIRATLSTTKSVKQDLQDALSRTAAELETKSSELDTIRVSLAGIHQTLAATQSANQDLQDTLARTAAELDTKTSELEAERIAHNKLEETLSTMQAERRETAATLTRITGELQAHLAELKEGRRARAAIEDQLRARTSDLENTILQLRKNNDQHCQRITELEAQLQQSTQALQDATREHANALAHVDGRTEQLSRDPATTRELSTMLPRMMRELNSNWRLPAIAGIIDLILTGIGTLVLATMLTNSILYS